VSLKIWDDMTASLLLSRPGLQAGRGKRGGDCKGYKLREELKDYAQAHWLNITQSRPGVMVNRDCILMKRPSILKKSYTLDLPLIGLMQVYHDCQC
jgi:hypothetical protein